MSKQGLRDKINQARLKGRKALIPFLPGGFPSKRRFWEEIMMLDEHCADIIEIGVPFSDPVADGPVVEGASIKCLAQGVNLEWIFAGLKEYRARLKAEIVLMGYFNPFLQFGIRKLMAAARETGVSGFIVPDLPLEEAKPYLSEFKAQGLEYIPLLGLNTSEARMEEYAEIDPAFVYMVSVLGITGSKVDINQVLIEKLKQAKEVFSCPIALGFGLKSPDQLGSIAEYIDAVVFGSALIKHIEDGGSCRDFIAQWG
ncbi:tryptophan synthase subunit alpha [Desulfovulcanus sp.]